MTPSTRHALRLAMRSFYTLTGFHVAILTAGVAHDGTAPDGGILPAQRIYLVVAAVCWVIAISLEGLTSRPGHRGK